MPSASTLAQAADALRRLLRDEQVRTAEAEMRIYRGGAASQMSNRAGLVVFPEKLAEVQTAIKVANLVQRSLRSTRCRYRSGWRSGFHRLGDGHLHDENE